jgi:multidrug resistance efflux pump
MTYPSRPVAGVVDSIGWGISQKDGSSGTDMLPQVSATFEWIRLAQRVPVRVHLVDVPEEVNWRGNDLLGAGAEEHLGWQIAHNFHLSQSQ